jgi:hypothetical protein
MLNKDSVSGLITRTPRKTWVICVLPALSSNGIGEGASMRRTETWGAWRQR